MEPRSQLLSGVQLPSWLHEMQAPSLQTWPLPQMVPSASEFVPVSSHCNWPVLQSVTPVSQTLVGRQLRPAAHATRLPFAQTAPLPQALPLSAALGPLSSQRGLPVLQSIEPTSQMFWGVQLPPGMQVPPLVVEVDVVPDVETLPPDVPTEPALVLVPFVDALADVPVEAEVVPFETEPEVGPVARPEVPAALLNSAPLVALPDSGVPEQADARQSSDINGQVFIRSPWVVGLLRCSRRLGNPAKRSRNRGCRGRRSVESRRRDNRWD